MAFTGSFTKIPCHCSTPQVARASGIGLPQFYVDIVIAGYWYAVPPQLYNAIGAPMTIVNFSGNFGNQSYYYKVYTKDVLGDVGLTKSNSDRVLCSALQFNIITWDDVIPQVYHRDSPIQFTVQRVNREGGKTLWKVQGCK